MKKIILWSLLGIFFSSCAPQLNSNPIEIQQLVDSENFTFMAKRVNPTNNDVVNVMNAMRGAGTATRMMDLDYGYTLVLKDKELEVTLPYFGRVFNPSYDNNKNSYRFTSKDFVIDKKQNKKGGWLFTIKTKDVRFVRNIFVEIFKNGRAYVSIDSDDRQPISYDGYVMKTQENTKKD